MTKHAYRCLIAVKAARKNAANTYWKNNIDLVGGDLTFTAGISGTGNPPATWFLTFTQLQEWQLAKLVEVADANSTDVRIAIWPYRKGVYAKLVEKMDGRSYITLAQNTQDPQDFLNAFNMQIVKVVWKQSSQNT